MSTRKLQSTRWRRSKPGALSSDKRVLLEPTSVVPTLPELAVVGVLNPAFVRVGDVARLFVRIDESPNQNGNVFTGPELIVPFVVAGSSPRIELASVTVPIDYDARREPVLPLSSCLEPRAQHRRPFLSYVSHIREAQMVGSSCVASKAPTLFPRTDLDIYGCEDARATLDDDAVLLTYSSVGIYGVSSSLVRIRPGHDDHSTILTPDHKHTCIFPFASGARYLAVTRPLSRSRAAVSGIWLIGSPDLRHWGDPRPLLFPRKQSWDSERVGPASPPLRLGDDWLLPYYAVDDEDSYHIGAAVLDGKDPGQVLYRTTVPILSPEESWECEGRRADAVFACGAEMLGKSLVLYYGAADTVVASASIPIDAVLAALSKG